MAVHLSSSQPVQPLAGANSFQHRRAVLYKPAVCRAYHTMMLHTAPFKPALAARGGRRRCMRVRAEAVEIPEGFKQIKPMGERVLVKVAEQEVKTRGGILLPAAAQKRPTSGDVVDLGDGRTGDGHTRDFYLKKGQTVLYSKFGFMYTDIKLGEEEYILIREDDVIGVLPRASAVADDIPEMQPLGDRVLLQVEEVADVTMGGVVLPESAKERPQSGTVVRVGPGKYDPEAEGKRKPMKLKEGDKVLYFKYAGDNMETPAGVKYTVLREDDVLCKAFTAAAAPPAAAAVAAGEQ